MPAVAPAQAVRSQYGPGVVLGKPAKAYREEPDVAADSNVETYVAMRLEIDNWRWAGVPFYVRTGKHMTRRTTEIAICFKQAPYAAFQNTPVDALRPNWMVLSIAPDEGISLQFEVKRRGPVVDLSAVKMDFRYDDWFPKAPNVGYETLIHDVMLGDQTLFMRADMVEEGWRIVQRVLDAWATERATFPVTIPAATGRGPPMSFWRATVSGLGDRSPSPQSEGRDEKGRRLPSRGRDRAFEDDTRPGVHEATTVILWRCAR